MTKKQAADISAGIPEDKQSITARFEKVYSSLPFEERKRPIVFMDDEDRKSVV